MQKIAPADTTVAFAARRGGDNPACTVYGHVTTRDPGPNRVVFSLTLPERSKGRFLFIGVGGAGGFLPEIPANLVQQGYAIAGTDKGTDAANGADFSFMADPAKALDADHRGLHVTAQATQAMTKAYYGGAKFYRYMTGCSGGGHMGMNAARYYGREDFDGIIAGACPMSREPYLANLARITAYIQSHPDGWISPELLARAETAILTAYDETDGARDGIIHDDRNIRNFDLGILRKAGFTPAQIATFELIRSPWHYPGARARPGGMEPGHAINALSNWKDFLMGTKRPPWKTAAQGTVDKMIASGAPFHFILSDTMIRGKLGRDYDYSTRMDFSKKADMVKLEGPPPEHDAYDYAAFARAGGKIFFYQGVSDQSVPFTEAIADFDAMAAQFPDLPSWARLYLIPGLLHCRGGPGPDDAPDALLALMADWVEKGTPPQSLVAEKLQPAREFLLCPYPNRARLKSPGADPVMAENWACEMPVS
jgi:feruloyl esterase